MREHKRKYKKYSNKNLEIILDNVMYADANTSVQVKKKVNIYNKQTNTLRGKCSVT